MPNLDTLPLHEPIFTTSQARAVAGVNASVFKNWTNGPNPVLPLGEEPRLDIRSPGTGHDHKITYATVLEIVIMSKLVALGLPPRVAAMAGAKFSHFGDATGHYVGQPIPAFRRPCQHYHETDGDTYLIMSLEEYGEVSFEVKPVNAKNGFYTLTDYEQRSVFAAVNVTKLDEDTRRKLGVSTELPRMAHPL